MNATFQLWKWHRETNYNITFKAITNSVVTGTLNPAPFSSRFSGFIGLAPYTADINGGAENLNFMRQLQTGGLITNNIVSIYTESWVVGNSSIIKFGGWDPEGILNSNSSLMTMLRTTNNL